MNARNSLQRIRASSLPFVKRNWRIVFIFLALVADSAAVVGSNAIAHVLHSIPSVGSGNVLPPFRHSAPFFWAVVIGLGLILGLYRAAYHARIRQQYFIGGKVYLYSIVAILILLFVTRQTHYPRTYLILFFVYLPLLFLLFRAVVNHMNLSFQRWGFGVFNALIVEYENSLDDVLINRFGSFPELGYRVKGRISKRANGDKEEVRHDLSRVGEMIDAGGVDSIFIPTVDVIENGYSELISLCKEKRVKLKVLSKESDELLRFVYVTDLAGISLYAPRRRRTEFIKKVAKRCLDLAGSIIAIAILSPVFLVVGAAILLEDGRPIFFKQRRALIREGKEFTFLKFRSMIKGAEAWQQELNRKNQTSGGLFMLTDDPRLTRVGKFIRKYSIDELPQLFCVLTGDMSLVGPRPLTISDLHNISPENKMGGYYKHRDKAKPGMTGLWQISGRREVGFREMVLLDLYYIEHQTILFDIEILAETLPVVLFGRGGY